MRALHGVHQLIDGAGHESSALGVARLLGDLLDVFVIDAVDADQSPAIRALGPQVVIADTMMTDDDARARVGAAVLAATRAVPSAR